MQAVTGGHHLANGLARTIAYARSHGKVVIFVRDVPDLAGELREYCKLDEPESLCSIPRVDVEKGKELESALLDRMKERFPDLWVFDPLPLLCDDAACYLMKDGHLLYRDQHHLSLDGSVRVGTALAELIRRASPESLH